ADHPRQVIGTRRTRTRGGKAGSVNAIKCVVARLSRGSCEQIGIKRYSPPRITARRGGQAIKKISRSILVPEPGLVSRWRQRRKPTPPCGDARRGLALDCNFFTASRL